MEPDWQSLRDIMADKTPSAIEREVSERPRWRVYWKDRSLPCLTIPATSDGEARRIALLFGGSSGIRKVERVHRSEK